MKNAADDTWSFTRIIAIAGCWMGCALSAQEVHAQADRVWLQPARRRTADADWYPGAITQVQGRVIDFDAKQLCLETRADDQATVLAADRVLWIQSGAVPENQQAMIEAFFAGEFSKSLSALPDVLRARPPVWRQQWLTMLAASAADQSGRPKIAMDLVSQLNRRPLPPLVIAWLPIHWTGGEISATASEVAKKHLGDPSPSVRLVAASWLLTSRDRAAAITTLKSIARLKDPLIQAKLAQCLSWTAATPPEVIESESKWLKQLESLPLVLQVGPSTGLEKKLRSAGRTEAADFLEASNRLTPIHPHAGLPR